MKHKVASRFDPKYKQDRCPKCGYLDQNFIFISDKELACYRCGTMFISRDARLAMKEVSFDMLKSQEEDRSAFVCEVPGCSFGENGVPFRAKTKAGLVAHMVKHKEG